MNTKELKEAIDSTQTRLRALQDRVELEMAYDLPFIRSRILEDRQRERDSIQQAEKEITVMTDPISFCLDSVVIMDEGRLNSDTTTSELIEEAQVTVSHRDESFDEISKRPAVEHEPVKLTGPATRTIWGRLTPQFLGSIPHDSLLLEGIRGEDRPEVISSVRASFRSMKDELCCGTDHVVAEYSRFVTSAYVLHFNVALALSCIIFVLIGGSMGSIVRKGGFGYSLLISIVFFVTFIMMTILFRKTSEGYRLSPVLAAYLPNLVLLPIGIFLVYKAVNDSKMSLDFSKLIDWFNRLRKKE